MRYWHDTSPAASAFGDVVVIAASGEPPIQIENVIRYCPYAASPIVRVIYAYDPALGYVPATPEFAGLYANQIAQDTQRAEAAKPGDNAEWDNTTKCSVLPMVLDYLYTGQTGRAWSELKRVYAFPDAASWQADIEKTVLASPRYAAP